MVDHLTPEKRSALMARIRSSDTVPEIKLRSALHRRGWRFRKNVRKLPGTPDIVFPSRSIVIFVDGDFWHGYEFDNWSAKLPEFWRRKIARNIERDGENNAALRALGWSVLRVWEHQISKGLEQTILDIELALQVNAK